MKPTKKLKQPKRCECCKTTEGVQTRANDWHLCDWCFFAQRDALKAAMEEEQDEAELEVTHA